MKKNELLLPLLFTGGGILFALGMCMCLIEEWGALIPGVIMGAAGAVVLIAGYTRYRRLKGMPRIKLSAFVIRSMLIGLLGALLLGLGMCMVMVWNMLVLGIIVGVVGIGILVLLAMMLRNPMG